MADFDSPSGPPPPKVPEGWVARWNAEYKEWFYVNIYTKKSQWDRPNEPVYPPPADGDLPPPGAPPSYSAGSSALRASDTKTNPYDTKNPARDATETDEEMARRLQREEDSRSRGAQDDYMNTQMPPGASSSYPADLPAREQKRGFLGKLLGKQSGSSPGPQGQYQQGQYQQGGYQQQQPYGYGSPPPGQYGGYGPPQGYGSPGPYGPGYGQPQPGYGYGGGYPPQQQQQQQQRPGMGVGTAAALGVGGGLLGGMLLGEAMDGGGGDDGGDYGGGDDGGGGDF